MKVVEGAKVYQCEFCGKKSHHGSSLSRHEKFCPKRPENQHQCFKHCKHLIKDSEGLVTFFKCAKTREFMYSYKLEKSLSNHSCASPPEEGDVRMPTQCDLYEDKDPNWNIGYDLPTP